LQSDSSSAHNAIKQQSRRFFGRLVLNDHSQVVASMLRLDKDEAPVLTPGDAMPHSVLYERLQNEPRNQDI
jgi:hypothetical protein